MNETAARAPMDTMIKVSAAVLVVVTVVYFVARAPWAESPREVSPHEEPVEPLAAEVELEGVADVSAAEDPTTEAVRRSRVAEEPPARVSAVTGTSVLRVVLEGITEEDAPTAKITLTAVDEREESIAEIRDSWPCQGSTSEFDLDPFFARVARRVGEVRVDEVEVSVDHPAHFLETTRIPLSGGVERTTGQTVYEVRMQLVAPAYWPELTLDVRDAETREHLEGVELCSVSPGLMGIPRQPGTIGAFTSLGGGLSSPIVLKGGREADDPRHGVAGLAVRPAPGEAPRLFELWHNGRGPAEHGVIVYARAPGYTWGSTVLEVSRGAEYEILLKPAAALHVRLMNVQLEGYAAHGTPAFFGTWFKAEGQETWFRADEGSPIVRQQTIDETLETEWLRLEGLDPGDHLVLVQLGHRFSPGEGPVLAREELDLAAGETRELVLELADPPAPPQRATLGGVVAFPAFGGSNLEGEEKVRLQVYSRTSSYRKPDVELALADMERVGGGLPTWSFHVEDLPVGPYRLQLLPFLKNALIELPAGGLEDVELVVPELAEVRVETVDGRTGERVPLDEFHYRREQALAGQAQNDRARADTEEPGRFRFWTAPGEVSMWPRNQGKLGYGNSWMDLELVPGVQSVRFELSPVHAMHFEFREAGVALPIGDKGMNAGQHILAVGHEGHVTSDGFQSNNIVEVSAPGVYEINFEGIDAERYHPIQPRRVSVRAGETTEVIVELQRR